MGERGSGKRGIAAVLCARRQHSMRPPCIRAAHAGSRLVLGPATKCQLDGGAYPWRIHALISRHHLICSTRSGTSPLQVSIKLLSPWKRIPCDG